MIEHVRIGVISCVFKGMVMCESMCESMCERVY